MGLLMGVAWSVISVTKFTRGFAFLVLYYARYAERLTKCLTFVNGIFDMEVSYRRGCFADAQLRSFDRSAFRAVFGKPGPDVI